MKSKNLFLGILILFTGVVALLASLNVFDFHWSIAWGLWPMILIICGIALLPLHEYIKCGILVLALALGCVLYHVENQKYQGNPVSRFFNRHFATWNWDDDDDDGYADNADYDDYDDYDDDDSYDNSSATNSFEEFQHFAEPYYEVAKASIDIDFGAGNLQLKAPCAELAAIDIESNFVKYSFRSEKGDDNTAIYINGKTHAKNLGKENTNDIDFALCSQPFWDLSVDMGAADADLDLSPYKMENVKIMGGACNIDLKLGDNGCDTNVDISTGASDINIKVPSSVDCKIDLESAISGKTFLGFEKVENGVWQTPGYGQNEHQIIIKMSSALSDISIERY